MSDEFLGSDTLQCSHCGQSIYADSPRCPKCGNYTDGLGQLGKFEEKPGHRLPRIFVIAGWVLIVALVLPIMATALQALNVLLQRLFSVSR